MSTLHPQGPLDLRRQASYESFYSVTESSKGSINFDRPMNQDFLKPQPLRLTTSTPMIQKRYQSDEEQPSPGMEEDDSDASSEADSEPEVELDDSIDLDAIEPVHIVMPAELARVVPIYFAGKPSLIDVAMLAPMAKRSRPSLGSRTPSATSIHRAVVAVPIPPRSQHRRATRSISLYEPPVVVDHVPSPKFSSPSRSVFSSGSANGSVTNFSTLFSSNSQRGPSPLAGTTAAATHSSSISTSSSTPPRLSSSSSDTASEIDEGDALMQEAADIQVHTWSSERERAFALSHGDYEHDAEHDSQPKSPSRSDETPTPTSYRSFDPYAYAMDSPGATPRRGSTVSVTGAAKKGWRGLVKGRRRGAVAL